MSDKTTSLPASLTRNEAGGWPGGWYIYENGKVDGPFEADAAFKMDAETVDGKPRLISRKGFTQWYALKDLSEIFKMTDQMGKKAQDLVIQSEAQLQTVAKAVTPPPPVVQKAAAPAKKTKSVVKPVAPTSAPSPASVVAESASAPASVVATQMAKTEAPSLLTMPSVFPESAQKHIPTRKAKRVAPAKADKAELMQGYFLARGRLRLGKLRNPWLTAFVGLPLTLFTYLAFWYGEIAREVSFHSRSDGKSPLPPGFLALVPGVHFYMIFRLAKLVEDMEAQNKYRSVSAWVATLFAVFPPFALAYLQDAANRHWLLHTKHTLVKKRADSEK